MVSRWGIRLVLAVGALQIVGWVSGWYALRGIGQLSAASPLPLVFSSHHVFSEQSDWETFSPSFLAEVVYGDGEWEQVAVIPKVYARLSGPYNRRNVYGAAISYGPVLDDGKPRAMRDAVLHYGFCDGGPLARLASRPEDVARAAVVATPRASRGKQAVWTHNVDCGGP